MKIKDKILITGINGLLGSALKIELKKKNFQNIFGLNSKNCDLMNLDKVSKFIFKIKPDYVIHCGNKVFGIGGNKKNQFRMLNDNLIMNSNLIKSISETKLKKFVCIGSTAVYSDKLKRKLNENDIFFDKPHSSEYYYGLSKRIMLEQLNILKKDKNIPFIYIVMNNLYGPRDNFNISNGHVVPSLIHKCIIAKEKSKSLEVWGNKNNKRFLLYSHDAANAIITMLKNNFDGVINLGSKHEYSINDLVNYITKILSFKGKTLWIDANVKAVNRREISLNKIRKLKFKENVSLDEGLKNTIDWLKKNYRLARK